MTLYEFNKLTLTQRKNFIYFGEPVSEFISLRSDNEFNYSLFDCRDFYAEIKISKALKQIADITGFCHDDERINLYIDFLNEHKDDDQFKLLGVIKRRAASGLRRAAGDYP